MPGRGGCNPPKKYLIELGYFAQLAALRADFLLTTFQIYPKMNNLLKVSALLLAVGLASCESKTTTTDTTTTPGSTMSTDSTSTSTTTMAPATDSASTMAPAAGTTTTDTKMTEEKK